MRLLRRSDVDRAHAAMTPHAPSPYYVSQYQPMERMYLPGLFTALRSLPRGRVLEVGPGWGTTAWWLAQRGHDVTVMDLMPLGTFITEKGLDEIGARYVHHDIEDAPAPEGVDLGTFDAVVMTQVIPHLAWRPDRALAHVAELLKPGGPFLTSVLDRADYPDLDATFGDDWRQVPAWRTTDQCTDVVKCMYDDKSFRALLETTFENVETWKPARSTVIFAKASTPA